MNESGRRYSEKVPSRETEAKESFFRRTYRIVDQAVRDTLRHLDRQKESSSEILARIQDALREKGVSPEGVRCSFAEATGLHQEATIEIGGSSRKAFRPRKSAQTIASPYRVALFGALLLDAGHVQASTVTPDCGDARPENAPLECGVQQWKGYSETNPAATAWMAIANTGTEACRVTITRLELSYHTQESKEQHLPRTVLSQDINGVQLLADGTQEGEWWGKYLHDESVENDFTIQPNTHGYIHPFGPIKKVPEDAIDLAVTFSAEITEGCVASAGIDTYEEVRKPTIEPPYTQNGSKTDFIKEAIKTPWVTETVDSETPVSFSIERLPRSERTGWSKE